MTVSECEPTGQYEIPDVLDKCKYIVCNVGTAVSRPCSTETKYKHDPEQRKGTCIHLDEGETCGPITTGELKLKIMFPCQSINYFHLWERGRLSHLILLLNKAYLYGTTKSYL